jgi:hypothetical protein
LKRYKKFVLVGMMLSLMLITCTGCFAGWGNDAAVHGGVFSNSKGDYVVLNESGGEIMDCWVLKDSYVKSESSSDGLTLVDNDGNGIIIQGDCKVMRINSAVDMNNYIEYHVETDLIPYGDFYREYKSK